MYLVSSSLVEQAICPPCRANAGKSQACQKTGRPIQMRTPDDLNGIKDTWTKPSYTKNHQRGSKAWAAGWAYRYRRTVPSSQAVALEKRRSVASQGLAGTKSNMYVLI